MISPVPYSQHKGVNEMELVFGLTMAVVLIIGSCCGYSTGQASLCEKQFQGEMHEGKCVKVQREEVK